MPIHKVLDGFMSLKQFQTFFWPPLRAVILDSIEDGPILMVLWEGACNDVPSLWGLTYDDLRKNHQQGVEIPALMPDSFKKY